MQNDTVGREYTSTPVQNTDSKILLAEQLRVLRFRTRTLKFYWRNQLTSGVIRELEARGLTGPKNDDSD